MSMKKKYTNAEKISIVKEGAKKGVKVILEKYGLYPATYYKGYLLTFHPALK